VNQHLESARAFLAIAESGDAKREAYRQAAEAIAAHREETGESSERIAIRLGKSKATIDKLVAWRRSGYEASTPFLMDEQATTRAAISHTKATLRDAPMEQIERVIETLPRERQQEIAASAGNAYHRARVEYREQERVVTPAERREREEAANRLTQPAREATAGFAALGIVGHLEQARDELHELFQDGSVTPRLIRQIDRALEGFNAELQVARALAGMEEE